MLCGIDVPSTGIILTLYSVNTYFNTFDKPERKMHCV